VTKPVPILRRALTYTLQSVAPLAVVALLTLLVLRLATPDWPHVGIALRALWEGAFGSPYDIGNTLNKTTPLILTGLACAIAFRMRLWNIGAEGQFLMGAWGASAVVLAPLLPVGTPAIVLIPAMMRFR